MAKNTKTKKAAKRLKPKQIKFIEEYTRNLGQSVKAQHACGIKSYQTVINWRKDPEFIKAQDLAQRKFKEALEAEGLKRALLGSDRLLEYFLAAKDPERYDGSIRKLKYLADNKQSAIEGGLERIEVTLIPRSDTDRYDEESD